MTYCTPNQYIQNYKINSILTYRWRFNAFIFDLYLNHRGESAIITSHKIVLLHHDFHLYNNMLMKNEQLSHIFIHRRLIHSRDKTLRQMYKLDRLYYLPVYTILEISKYIFDCYICQVVTMTNTLKVIIQNIHDVEAGKLFTLTSFSWV